MLIWIIEFLSCFLRSNAAPSFSSCDQSPRFSECQMVNFNEELLPGTRINTFKFSDPGATALTFRLTFTGTNLYSMAYLSILSRPFEFDLVVASRIDKEDFILYSRTLNFDMDVTSSVNSKFNFFVSIIDIDDNFPIFNIYPINCQMKENDITATCNNLAVVDYDQVNNICNVKITSVTSGSISDFSITKVSVDPNKIGSTIIGYSNVFQLSLTAPLDYEKYPMIQLQLQAQDSAYHVSINYTFIQVIDVQDQPPIFQNVPYSRTMNEELPVDTYVIAVTAVDGDKSLRSPVQYSLKYGNPFNQYFGINETNGEIRITATIDRESQDITSVFGFFDLIVIATETDPSSFNSTETSIRIYILDINDCSADFDQPLYQGSVYENSQAGVTIYFGSEIMVEDKDLYANAQYNLSAVYNNKTSDIFEIYPILAMNKAILVIRVKNGSGLDYEQIKSINVSIKSLQTTPVFNIAEDSYADVSIAILDVNDNTPIFGNASYKFMIFENSPNFTLIGVVAATDKDSGLFGKISYSLSDSYKRFVIDSSTGIIYTNVKADIDSTLLDREAYESLSVVVIATDGGGLMKITTVIIMLKDLNDNPPIFEAPFYQAWLIENSYNFTSRPVKVKATDKDVDVANNRILYKLYNISVGPPNYLNNFKIDASTGDVTVVTPVDRELIPNDILDILVVAYDPSNSSIFNTCIVQIIVRDVNDNAPVFGLSTYSVSIPQNISTNNTILFLNATDSDESNTPQSDITYRLIGVDSLNFIVEAVNNFKTGVNIRKDSNSRLQVKVHNFTMEASDRGSPPLSSTVTILINVTEINDEPPIFTKPLFSFSTVENSEIGTFIGQVNATDPDINNNLAYFIMQNTIIAINGSGVSVNSMFNVTNLIGLNQSAGVVYVQSLLDREKYSTLIGQIQVIDKAAETPLPPQTAYTTFRIDILDVNDNPPIFQTSLFQFSLFEDFHPKSNISTGATGFYVKATDVDIVGTLQYLYFDPSQSFYVDLISGQIFLIKALDRETVNNLNFTVSCSDGVFLVNSTVSMIVLDVNDNEPYFVDDIRALNISEITQAGTILAKFVANDSDAGENARVIFYFPNNSTSPFGLSLDGYLTLITPLTIYGIFYYKLVIEIMDNPSGTIHFKKSKEVTIYVIDVNNNFPIFSQAFYDFNPITENVNIGATIGEVLATDKDLGENGNVSYKILPQKDTDAIILQLFKIQKVNDKGQILVNSSLKNIGARFTFIVTAMDNGIPRLSINCTVVITIIDFNDNYPNFTNPIPQNVGSSIQFSIYENTIALITIISATDSDSGLNGDIRFNLDSMNGDHEFFIISPISGNLSNVRSFDRETKFLYKFRVLANDLGTPSLTSAVNIEVLVLDLDDNLPIFPSNYLLMNFSIYEGPMTFTSISNSSLNGFKIGNVATAMDKDIGNNSLIAYIFIGDAIIFYLDPFSGDLYGLKEFDRETKDTYMSTVRAVPMSQYGDGPHPFLSGYSPFNCSEAKVVVIILDINDNPPVFTVPTILGGIVKFATPGSQIVDISKYVTDKDIVSQNALTYWIEKIFPLKSDLAAQLKNLNIGTVFALNITSGILSTAPGVFFQDNVGGFIQISVGVSDGKYKNFDQSIINFISSTQQIIAVIQNYPSFVVTIANDFSTYLSNKLNINITVDSVELFKDVRGNIPSGLTNLFIHAVNLSSNTVMNGSDLLLLLNQQFSNTADLTQKFQLLDFRLTSSPTAACINNDYYKFIMITLSCSFFIFIIIITVFVWMYRSKYQRKLRAYCTPSVDKMTNSNNVKLPGTNIYEKDINPLSNANQNNLNVLSPKLENKGKLGVPVYGNDISFDDLCADINNSEDFVENTETEF